MKTIIITQKTQLFVTHDENYYRLIAWVDMTAFIYQQNYSR